MNERRDGDKPATRNYVDNLVIVFFLFVWFTALIMDGCQRTQLRDLQRRVGQLESINKQ